MPAARPRRAAQEAMQHMAEPASDLSLGDDGDSDFEEPMDPAPKSRGKKRKVANESTGGKRKVGVGRGKVKAAAPLDDEEAGGSLFEIVKTGKASLQSVVDVWIENYKADRDASLLELIQFFIQCSGCKGKITPYMYANMEHADIIRKMTEEFDEESGDYPLIVTGPAWKKFKTNFCEFVQVLVRQCQYSIIYDQYMMDNVISLLTGLTDSQVRAFRHTSTLAAIKLMTALVDVALNLSINLDNTQRQYDAERQKSQNKRATDRLNLLLVKRQELEENQAEIRNMLTYIFRGVFVHRYRDTQAEIRSICIKEIGVWMKKYPNMFLDDGYLKYVGWTLYDKQGDVRLGCLRALYPLYDTQDLCHKLELFTNRFKDRIVEMTLDKETEVAVQAVKLVISVLAFGDIVLSDKDCENVYELVYSSHRQVAQAAGEFLNAKLFRRDEDAPVQKSAKGKKRSPNTPLIRDLVQFFIESELHEHGAYLVDSLWEINTMMKDWECMTDLLMEEAGKGEETLDDRQETSLIEIMVCCVKQAATGECPIGRGPHNKKLTAKENKSVQEDKTRMTEHFIVALPQLLLKYLMDPEKMANLLQIPQYFDLEIYTSSRQEKHLESLLRYLHEIVEKHTDHEVLDACTKCFESLCSEEYAISGKCDVARKTLIDGLVVKFKEAMQDFFTEGEIPDDDEVYALIAALKRINAFSSCHDLSSWELWDDLIHIAKLAADNTDLPDEIVCKAQTTCFSLLLWSLHHLEDNVAQRRKRFKKDIDILKKRQSELMKHCTQLLHHQRDKVCEEAYLSICDGLIVFSKNLGDNLKQLVYVPENSLQNQLSSFLMDKVFVEEDDDEVDENVKIEELHKRRNFLACFCKLIVYNVFAIKVAAPMFKHYMKFYNDYGDIIKATLSKAREINKVATAKTLAMSLIQLFQELQNEQGGLVDRVSEAFQSIKELSRRFSLSFGLDAVKNRDAVAAMHSVKDYIGRSKELSDVDESLVGDLSQLERRLLTTQDLMRVRGKRGRPVPVLIPADVQPILTYLTTASIREEVGIMDDNKYLFPNTALGAIRSYDSVKTVCDEIDLKHPERITSVNLRKYTATLCQLLASYFTHGFLGEGILFSLSLPEGSEENPAPPNIAFLEVLCEFTNKLMKQDKKTVLNYLDKQLGGVMAIQRNSDEWQALLTYRNSLVQGEHEIHPITLKQAAQKRYGKRKAATPNPHSEAQGDQSNVSDQSHLSLVAPTPTPNVGMPQHQSTAVKRRRMDEESNPSEPGSETDFQDSVW